MTDQKADVDTCPLVSVCIPTYNRCEQLKTAVESVLKGSYDHVAIIISDNASSDGTQEWCESVCAADNRVSYFRHEVNQGPTRNFEFARSKANGQYFMWLGDDDYLSPDYIEVCVAALEADASLVLVSGVGRFHTGNVLLDLQPDFFQLTAGPAFVRVAKYLWLVGDNSIYYGIYRSEMVENISLVNCIAGDWVWMAEVLARGKAKMVDPIIVHREQGDNTSSSMENMVKVLALPTWNARFPRTAIAMNLIRYVGVSNREAKRRGLGSISVHCAVASVVFLKALRSSARQLLRFFIRERINAVSV